MAHLFNAWRRMLPLLLSTSSQHQHVTSRAATCDCWLTSSRLH
jgi:hypothetical protein